MTAFPTFRTEPHFTLDNYRRTHERGSRVRKCYPGRGGCDEYPFPHRHGSGWCRYNSRVTCEERMKREGVEG